MFVLEQAMSSSLRLLSVFTETSHAGAAAGGRTAAPEDAGPERRGAESAGEPVHGERPPYARGSHLEGDNQGKHCTPPTLVLT